MKKSAAFFAFFLVSGSAYAVVPTPALPAPPPMPAPQIGGVKAAVLLDVNTDQILLDQNGNTSYDPSGLVKLMTAYLLYQAEAQKMVQPDERISVSVDAEEIMGYTFSGQYETWISEQLGKPAILIELPTATGRYFSRHQSIMWQMVGP